MGSEVPPQMNVSLLHRRESRVVRPFYDAADYLSDTAIRLTHDSDLLDETSIYIDDYDIERILPSIFVSPPGAGFEERVGASLDQLRLLITMEDGFLKQTSVLRNLPLASINEKKCFTLTEVQEQPLSWLSEIRIHISVILANDRAPEPGFASRKGSWIARKTFRIGHSPNVARFHVEYVDEEWFHRHRLPRKTTYYVAIDGDVNAPVEESSDTISVYVSRSVAQAIGRNESSPINRAFTTQIYVDAITALLTTGLVDDDTEPTPDGLLDIVSARIAREAGISQGELRQQSRENGASALRPYVQAAASLSRLLVEASRR